ncbi:hypothetical protein Tco_0333588 [Tanacetum coccineum]
MSKCWACFNAEPHGRFLGAMLLVALTSSGFAWILVVSDPCILRNGIFYFEIPPSTYILWICVVPTSAEIINGSSPVSSVFLGRSKHFQRWLKHFHALEGSQRTLGDNSQHRNDLGMERDCQHGSFILQLGAEVARVGEDDFGLGERRSGFARGRKGMGEASTVVLVRRLVSLALGFLIFGNTNFRLAVLAPQLYFLHADDS